MRDALLHPQTRERLEAVRRWAEAQPGAAFPPSPLTPEEQAVAVAGGPIYAKLGLGLEL